MTKMDRLIVTISIVGGLVVMAAISRADGDIVYSAQKHRITYEFYVSTDEKRSKIVEDVGSSHLYTCNPDGSNRRQITFGTDFDVEPKWSPDGRKIAFIRKTRDTDGVTTSGTVCVVSAVGGTVTTFPLPKGLGGLEDPQWSADSRLITACDDDGEPRNYFVVDTARHSVNPIKRITDFQWAPNAPKCFVRNGDKSAAIWDWRSKREIPIANVVQSVVWLPNGSLLCETPTKDDNYGSDDDESYELSVLTGGGRVLRKTTLVHRKSDPIGSIEDGFVHRRLIRLGTSSTRFLVETQNPNTAGMYFACLYGNMNNDTLKYVAEGEVMGTSPDGNNVIVSDDNWVGPYKHGAAQVGPIMLVNLKTGKKHTLVSGLISEGGGDWRQKTN